MRRCAFLTLEDPTGYTIDDHLAIAPLRTLGWEVDMVPWSRTGVDWHIYHAVVIRSTWDYMDDLANFLRVLDAIEDRGTALFNPLELVRWNVRKTYLRDLAARGVPTVPTLWRDRLEPGELPSLLEELNVAEAVIKPVVGANAGGAFRVQARTVTEELRTLEAYYVERPLMLQPFMTTIVDEGEYSLFYFDGAFSHAILKRPKTADFRVQEEHGGLIRPVQATEALRQSGEVVMRSIGTAPLYARVDLVRSSAGDGYWLMELELVEPALYFRMDDPAAGRFARALDARVAHRASPQRSVS